MSQVFGNTSSVVVVGTEDGVVLGKSTNGGPVVVVALKFTVVVAEVVVGTGSWKSKTGTVLDSVMTIVDSVVVASAIVLCGCRVVARTEGGKDISFLVETS